MANLEFAGHVTPPQIAGYLARTDICVFPSLWENFPNVCLEAMSAARGIVASREGGMKDMLEDIEGGILIEPTDSPQLADAVCEMLDDPRQRRQRGERCREKIVDFYADQVVRDAERYYLDVAHGQFRARLDAA